MQSDAIELAQLLALLRDHSWLAAVALLAGFVARVSKSDVALPFNVPARWRPLVLLVVGALGGAAQLVAGGAPWRDALTTALGAPVIALLGHVLGIHVVRNGREIPLPGLMAGPPPRGPSDPPGTTKRITFPPKDPPPSGGLGAAALVMLALGLSSCAPPAAQVPGPARCVDLSDRAAIDGAISKGAAALAGAGGPAVALVEDQTAQLTLAASGALLGGLAVGFGFAADARTEAWKRECSR